MKNESTPPAASASPTAGACRDARASVPAFSGPWDFDRQNVSPELLPPRRRISTRWIFVGPYAVPAPPHLFVRVIQQAVEAHYRLNPGALRSARRDRFIARPRQLAMYLARRLAGRSLPEIGRLFGDRDHTTVLHAIRAIEALRLSDPELERDLVALCARLTAPELIGAA